MNAENTNTGFRLIKDNEVSSSGDIIYKQGMRYFADAFSMEVSDKIITMPVRVLKN